jgi:nucleotide-binding universal stress UspA family protein
MEALRQMAQVAGVPVTVNVQHGDPAGVVLLHAAAQRADLLVMGTNERTGWERLRSGSVAERIQREAVVPVLIVPSRDSEVREDEIDLRVVAAVDFGPSTSEVVERAASLASSEGRVTLVNVVATAPSGELTRYVVPEYRALMVQSAVERCRGLVDAAEIAADVRVVTGIREIEISRVADEVRADMIVLGASPRNVLSQGLFGSLATRVIRLSGRPVLVVPPPAKSPRAAA